MKDNQLLFSVISEICLHQRQTEETEEEVEKLQLKIREYYTDFSIWAGHPFKNGLYFKWNRLFRLANPGFFTIKGMASYNIFHN